MLYITVCDDEKPLTEKIKNVIYERLEELQVECKIDCFCSGDSSLTTNDNIGRSEPVIYDFVDVGTAKVWLDEISYIENDLHKLTFHLLRKGTPMKWGLYRKIDEVEKDFTSGSLVRVHQSFLVNMEYVKEIKRYEIIMLDGTIIPVSKKWYKQAQDLFQKNKGATF
jgi:DNA-binding LytR/AlgR family response regulator